MLRGAQVGAARVIYAPSPPRCPSWLRVNIHGSSVPVSRGTQNPTLVLQSAELRDMCLW